MNPTGSGIAMNVNASLATETYNTLAGAIRAEA